MRKYYHLPVPVDEVMTDMTMHDVRKLVEGSLVGEDQAVETGFENWYFNIRDRNMTQFGVLPHRDIFSYILPFHDNRFADLISRTSNDLRQGRMVIKKFLQSKYPVAAGLESTAYNEGFVPKRIARKRAIKYHLFRKTPSHAPFKPNFLDYYHNHKNFAQEVDMVLHQAIERRLLQDGFIKHQWDLVKEKRANFRMISEIVSLELKINMAEKYVVK